MAGTLSVSDIYGNSLPQAPTPPAGAQERMSGGADNTPAPAFAWVGALLILVALRVVYEVAK